MCVCVMVLCVCVLVLPVRSLNTHKADTLKWFIDEISVSHLKSLSADMVYTIHLFVHLASHLCIRLYFSDSFVAPAVLSWKSAAGSSSSDASIGLSTLRVVRWPSSSHCTTFCLVIRSLAAVAG